MDFDFNNGPFDHGAWHRTGEATIAGDGAVAIVPNTAPALLSLAGDGAVAIVPNIAPALLSIAGDGVISTEMNLAPVLLSIAGDGAVTASGLQVLISSLAIAGDGAVTASGLQVLISSLAIAGDGVLAVVPSIGPVSLSIAGDGAISASGLQVLISSLSVAGDGAISTEINLAPALLSIAGDGALAVVPNLAPALISLAGDGLVYVSPTQPEFPISNYQFESIAVSRSAQDQLWSCTGQIDGLTVPTAYFNFTISVDDHNDVSRTIFFGFVPGRDHMIQVAANKSGIQGYDAGFYLTRQYLPAGDLSYSHALGWTPMGLIKYWLGEETLSVGSTSKWEQVSGIKPYRIHNPGTYGHDYTDKDFVFQPTSTKGFAIQDLCEYSHMVFLVKWKTINDIMVPCAYFVHEDDIDDDDHGLDLPAMVDITDPDSYLVDGVQVTEKSDERYNRIIVRSSTTAGGWLEYTKQTQALDDGDELPIEYLEERSDLGTIELVTARAEELYTYYTEYAFTYSMILINRTDLELYQRCRFYSYGYIPEGTVMRIVAIQYTVMATHTEVQISVTPDSRLSDLRRLQKSQVADVVSSVQDIAKDQIEEEISEPEIATVATVDGSTGTVTLERGGTVAVRYIEE